MDYRVLFYLFYNVLFGKASNDNYGKFNQF